MRNRNKQICKGLSITDHRVPKDTLKDKEKIKKEGKNTNTGISLSRSLKNQRKEKPVVRGENHKEKKKMSQKKNKEKERGWNSSAYLVSLAKKKEPVILHLNSNTIDDESELKGIIIGVDNYTIAFLADTGRELLVFKHSIRFIEKVLRR